MTNLNERSGSAGAVGSSASKTVVSKRAFGAFMATLAMLISIGVVAPTASAVEPSGEDVYELTVNGKSVTLDEGEPVTFALAAVQPKPVNGGGYLPDATYVGDGGTITVIGSKGVYYFSIKAPCAISFTGSFHITDLTSGLGGGYTLVTDFYGSAPTSKLRGHKYSGTLNRQGLQLLGSMRLHAAEQHHLHVQRLLIGLAGKAGGRWTPAFPAT